MISASCRKASGDIVPGFRVFTATSTLFCQVPFQTSPKLPAPSFLVSWICDLGISYWSLVAYSRALLRASLGAGRGQAFVSWQHRPFPRIQYRHRRRNFLPHNTDLPWSGNS